MDLNITNFDVTTKEIKLSQTAELPIDIDISLSEYEPDIKKILKCNMVSYISSKQISGNGLAVEGNVTVTLIYCDKDKNLNSVQKQIPFKKNFEASSMLDGGEADVYAASSVNSYLLLTESKVAIKATVRLEATVTVSEKKSVISDLDNDCFEQLRGDAKATTPIGRTSKSFIIDEEFELDTKELPIAKIINCSYFVGINETKIISNKIVVKGQLNINVFYRTNQNTFECYKNIIPFNQIVDINGVTEDCKCDTTIDICSINLTTRTSSNGECRTMMLVAKLMVNAEAICESEIPIIYDLYSKRHETDIVKKDICFDKIIHQSKEIFMCKKNIVMPENEVKEIVNLWCESGKCICRFNETNLTVSGSVTVCTIFRDAQNEAGYFERIIDFDFPIEIMKETASPKCKCKAEILNTTYSLNSSGDIELSLELQIMSTVYDTVNMEVITEVTVNESKMINNTTSLIAYFAESGENVWEISKSFLADRTNFIALNEIKEETIKTPKMLLIPRF